MKKRGGTIQVEVADSWLREYQVSYPPGTISLHVLH